MKNSANQMDIKKHSAIVIVKDKKFLFAQRSAVKKSLPNMWAFPSGTIEAGESPEQTAVREAKEELGADVVAEKQFAKADLPELSATIYFVLCRMKSEQDIIFDQREIQAIKWMSFEDFFQTADDSNIGHGLIYLRKHPEIWEKLS